MNDNLITAEGLSVGKWFGKVKIGVKLTSNQYYEVIHASEGIWFIFLRRFCVLEKK